MNVVRRHPNAKLFLGAPTLPIASLVILATLVSLACGGGGGGGGGVSSPVAPAPTTTTTTTSSNSEIRIEAKTNGDDADTPPGPSVATGTTVTWTYRVHNVGTDTLSGISLIDDMRGAIRCPADTLLEGESMTCRDSDVATLGQYANVATVTASGNSGEVMTDSDPSHYIGEDVAPPPPGGELEGCGVGFWKTNVDKSNAQAWPPAYRPSMTLAAAGFVNAVGMDPSAYDLLASLSFSGGPALEDWERNMTKHAVAALLNAATTSLNYPWSVSRVLDEANEALASNDKNVLNAQKDEFEEMNSLGCPLP